MKRSVDGAKRQAGYRALLLGGVSALVLGSLGTAAGFAADVTVTTAPLTVTAQGAQVIDHSLVNTGPVTGTASGSSIAQTIAASGELSSSTRDNTIASTATANSIGGLIAADLLAGDGVAVASVAINGAIDGPAATVAAATDDATVAVTITDLLSGAAAVSANRIAARTVANNASSMVSGAVPVGYGSDMLGTSSLDQSAGAATATTTGSITITSVEQNLGTGQAGGSGAVAEGNRIGLAIGPSIGASADQQVTASVAVDVNAISAAYAANAAASRISLETGANPAFFGSAAITNIQANLADAGDAGPAASNVGSVVSGSVSRGASGVDESLSGGALSVSGNSITADAAGNRAAAPDGSNAAAGNLILLADGLSFIGPFDEGADARSSVVYDLGALHAEAGGGLSITNAQTNAGSPIASLTGDALVIGQADHLDAASIAVSANSIGATATGNVASNAILAPDTGASLTPTLAASGLAALTSVQTNETGTEATASGNAIVANVGYMASGGPAGSATGSTVAMRGNTIGARGFGNDADNAIGLSANDVSAINSGPPSLAVSRDSGGTGDIAADAFAGVTLANVQTGYAGSDVSARNEAATIELLATGVAGPLGADSLSIAGGGAYAAEAVAVSNNAVNAVALDATTLLVTAGVLNVQTADATTTAALADPRISLQAGGADAAVAASTLSVAGNTLRSVAYGNSSSSSLAGTAATLLVPGNAAVPSAVIAPDLGASGGLALDRTTAPVSNAMYALMNDQAVTGDVSSSVTQATAAPLEIAIGTAGILGSGAFNDANSVVAGAYGNQTSNALTLDAAAALAVEWGFDSPYTPAAALVNLQTVGDGVEVLALLDGPAGGGLFRTSVGNERAGDVAGSTLSVSGNLAQALAYGNWADANKLSVSATTLTIIADAARAGLTTGTDDRLTADLAFVLQNAQQGGAGLIAAIQPGEGGSGARIDVAGSVSGSSLAMGVAPSVAGNGTAGNRFLATAYDNSAVNELGLEATTLAASAGIQSFQNSAATIEAALGTGSPVRQLITVGGDIDGSTLAIHGSVLNATAVANNVGNMLSVAANTLTGGGAIAAPGSSIAVDGSMAAAADYAVSNDQRFGGDGAFASVASEHGIAATGLSPVITGSSLSITGITQQAAAEGNLATNGVVLSITEGGVLSPAPTGAPSATVLSRQLGIAPVVADSTLDIAAPGALDTSRLVLSGNANTALAVMNDVVNVLVVSANNIGSATATGSPAVPPNATASVNTASTGHTVAADFSLLNQQVAGEATVSATATTRIRNGDDGKLATSGLSGSSADMSNNSTAAEADGNRAANGLSVAAGSTAGGTAAILNSQTSNAAVSASATSSVTFSLSGGDGGSGGTAPALNSSSVNIGNNSTTATAQGNYANNVLNAAPSAMYGPSDPAGPSSSTGPAPTTASGSASYVVLNDQNNTGPVSATVNATYTTTLNGSGAVPSTVNNGTVTMYGNSAMASAYGNYANNTVVLSGLNGSGTTTSINNIQSNSGPVTATVSFTQGSTVSGGVTNGAYIASGGPIQAVACGNCAVNMVTSR